MSENRSRSASASGGGAGNDERKVRVSRHDHVAQVVMSRPARRNALDVDMCERLLRALREVDADADVRVVLLRGEPPAFCAGADFGDFEAGPERGGFIGVFHEVLDHLAHMRVPIVAYVNGPAIGAGCQILVQCDLRVAARSAEIGITGARIGLMLDMENINRLVCEVGPLAARRLLLTGDLVDADEAAALGIVHAVAADDEAAELAADWARSVAERAPLAVQGHKAAIQSVVDGWWLAADTPSYTEMTGHALRAFMSPDLREGLEAFAQRRKPEFGGAATGEDASNADS